MDQKLEKAVTPEMLAEMILSLDHYRMEETYYEEGRETYDYA